MGKVCFGDVVRDVKVNVDRANNPYDYYVAGDHMDTEDLRIRRRGKFSEPPEPGPAFIRAFKPGQILYGSRRTYLKKVAVADFEGVCANTTFVLDTIDDAVFLQRLLPFLMYSERFTQYSINNSKGSTNPYILFSDLAKYEFDLPSLAEQNKLADLLWAANSTREAYKKLITATDELVKSRFVEMFGDPETNEKGLPLVSLNDCCIINPRKSNEYRLAEGLEVSFIPMSAVSEKGTVDLSETRLYDEVRNGFTYFAENDVLFAKITPCMENGKGAIMKGLHNGVGFGSTEFHVLRPKESISNPYWLYQITAFDAFRKNAAMNMTGSAGQRRVPTSYLENYTVGLPPIDAQTQFADFVQAADKSKFIALKQASISVTIQNELCGGQNHVL